MEITQKQLAESKKDVATQRQTLRPAGDIEDKTLFICTVATPLMH